MLRAVAIALFFGFAPPALFWALWPTVSQSVWIVLGGLSAAFGSFWVGWYSRYFYAIWPFFIVGCHLAYPMWTHQAVDPMEFGFFGFASFSIGGLLPGFAASKMVEERLAARGLIFPNGRPGDDDDE